MCTWRLGHGDLRERHFPGEVEVGGGRAGQDSSGTGCGLLSREGEGEPKSEGTRGVTFPIWSG